MNEQHEIKVGDTVLCINDKASFNRLKEGCEYIVDKAYDGSPVVIVNGAYHGLDRFVKAEG